MVAVPLRKGLGRGRERLEGEERGVRNSSVHELLSRYLCLVSTSKVSSTTSGGDTQLGWGDTVVQSWEDCLVLLLSCSSELGFQAEDRL